MREIISTFIHYLCFGDVRRAADCDFPAKKTKGNLPWVRIPVSPLNQDSFPNDLTRATRCTRVTPMMTTAKIYRSASNTGIWVEEAVKRINGLELDRTFVKNDTVYEIGNAPFMELEVFGQSDNATLIYRDGRSDPFTVVLRGTNGEVNGAMKVSGIRVIV